MIDDRLTNWLLKGIIFCAGIIMFTYGAACMSGC